MLWTNGRWEMERREAILHLADRAAAASLLIRQLEYRIPVVLDNMDNEVRIKYACWPLRFYVIDQGKIWYKAQPSQYRYSVPGLRDSLLTLLQSKDVPRVFEPELREPQELRQRLVETKA